MEKKQKNYWGFDTKNIDQSVRPQDDFYQYANGGWLKRNKIPADESRWGSFTILRYETEHQLKNIVEGLLKKKYPAGSKEQLVRDMYDSAMDLKRREKLGSKPIEEWRKKIHAISSKNEILQCISEFHKMGISSVWDIGIDQDAKNSSKYILHLFQGGLGMPERDYYLLGKPEQKRVREAYQKHIVRLLMLAGIKKKEAEKQCATILKFETALAQISMNKEDTRDIDKTYHKKSLAKLSQEAPEIDWKNYFIRIHAGNAREFIVMQPQFLTGIGKMLHSIPLEQWKIYLEWHLINDTAGLLSKKFVSENFHFYSRTLTGTQKMRAPWRRALGGVNGNIGEALGQLYVTKHFSPQSKKMMDGLVNDLFSAYGERMRNLDWMSAATKRKALQKLRAVVRKIGYPTKWKNYRGLVLTSDDYFGNVLRGAAFSHKREMSKLQKSVDRTEWFMTPQTVNAYCHFSLNEIVFPAAILQFPFFDPEADMAVNYAAIGSVIGHEISHAFDDQGSKFDGKGNLKSWWTKEDRKRYMHKAQVVVDQFNRYTVASGISVSGKLTQGENIADLAGAAIAFDAYQKYLHKVGRKNINGLTPEERFFFGFAQQERELSTPESAKMRALTDPHSDAPLRINGPVSNLQEFYDAFGVKKGDKLYREPKDRAKIW